MPSGKLLAEAGIFLRELEEVLEIEFPDEGDYETLAGFLLEEFGRIPVRGDTVTWENVTFEVLGADRRRIESVQITVKSAGGRR